MKKIVFSVFVFLGLIYNISAQEVYYSNYSESRICSTENQESSELINVEAERIYRFYSNHEKGEYHSLLEENSGFQFVDLDKKIDSEYSSWSTEIPLNVEKRVIETKVIYSVKRPKPIKNFYITNTGDTNIILDNIEIYFDGKSVAYKSSTDLVGEQYIIQSGDYLKLSLNSYYDLQKIIIKIDEANFSQDNELHISATVPSSDGTYYISYFRVNLDNTNNKNIVISARDWIRTNAQYDDEIILEYNPDEPLSILSETKYYRYQDPAFYFYNIYKDYIDGYFNEYSEFIKDENDFLDFYCIRTREKFEIAKEVEIVDYNQKISDFINSTVNYTVKGDFNMYKNGIYSLEFITDFITLKKNVVVNIKENLLHNCDNQCEDMRKNLDETNGKYEQSIEKLEKLKIENNKLIQDINNLSQVNDILRQELRCKICSLNLKSENLKTDDVNAIDKANIVCLALIVLVLIVLLLIFLKNLSNKNKF